MHAGVQMQGFHLTACNPSQETASKVSGFGLVPSG